MYEKSISFTITILITCLAISMTACGPEATTPEPILETVVVTEIVEGTPMKVIHLVTPTPEPTGPRSLVICMGQEPDSLFFYGTGMLSAAQIFEAIYDGPLDNRNFAYQPVILEKLPSLSDGDAFFEIVPVNEGDTVVDANGEVVTLDASADPPITLASPGGGGLFQYQGGPAEMEQLSATFTLLPGIEWSDGTPLTADDSVYGYQLHANPDIGGLDHLIKRTASYETLDELTTQWKGLPGFRDPIYYTNFFMPGPEHIWGQYAPKELLEKEESSRKPPGWGPYIIDEWVQGDSITLKKNQNYWRSDEGLPIFDTVVYRFTGGSGNANLAALIAGECDIADQTSGVDSQNDLLLKLHKNGQINAYLVTGTAWEHLDFGIQHVDYDDGYQVGIDRPDFFSDVRMRQAFLMCMDRQAVVDTALFGQSEVIDTYLPSNHPLFNPEVRHYDFDPQAGQALLEEVGWVDDDSNPSTPRIAQGVRNITDGTPLEVNYETTEGSLREQVTAIIQNSLNQCGIMANIKLYPAPEWFSEGPEGKLFGRRYDLGEYTLLTGVDPPCDLYLSSYIPGPIGETWISIQDTVEREFPMFGWWGWNNSGFANQDYDTACNTALNSLAGQPEYESSHLEAQRIFAEQLPVAPLFSRLKTAATRPDFCNFNMDPTAYSEFWNIEHFDYGPTCEK